MLPLILLFLVSKVHSELEYDSYRIWQVTESNLEALTSKHSQVHLFMHQPGCKHSEEYKVRYAQLAIDHQQNGNEVTMGITNCEKEHELCNKLGVTNFPTLILVDNQKPSVIDEI